LLGYYSKNGRLGLSATCDSDVVRTCYVEIGMSFRRRTDAIRGPARIPPTVVLVDIRYH